MVPDAGLDNEAAQIAERQDREIAKADRGAGKQFEQPSIEPIESAKSPTLRALATFGDMYESGASHNAWTSAFSSCGLSSPSQSITATAETSVRCEAWTSPTAMAR
jgi:hypothetical protein